MKWNRYTIETTTAAEDYLSSMLMELGIEGIEIEDNVPLTKADQADMFIDFLPELPPDEGISHVSFYIEDDGEDHSELLKQVKIALEELRDTVEVGSGVITSSETEDLDWINNWKKYFHQFYIDELLVIPSWEEVKPEDADKKILHIDPGTAFGTGMHETTQLCIRQIKKYVTPETNILDVGCGSGILAILALMYGAKHAKGTDLDPCALDATLENMEANGINPKDFEVIIGNIISEKEVQDWAGYECYDIVVANILHNVLEVLTPVVTAQMKPGAIYITSGIIAEKEDFVVDVVKKAGLELVEVTRQGEWVSVTAKKPE